MVNLQASRKFIQKKSQTAQVFYGLWESKQNILYVESLTSMLLLNIDYRCNSLKK